MSKSRRRKAARRRADPDVIMGATWSGESLLVEFETGERFLIPVDALACGRRLRRDSLRTPDRWTIAVSTVHGEDIDFAADFVRYECDARYRREADRAAEAERIEVGRRVAAARERAGLTQAALAKRSRVSRVAIARVETGAADPSYSTLEKLAKAMSLTVSELLGGVRSSAPRARPARRRSEAAAG